MSRCPHYSRETVENSGSGSVFSMAAHTCRTWLQVKVPVSLGSADVLSDSSQNGAIQTSLSKMH